MEAPTGTRLERAALLALVAFTVLAVLGYGVFALRPQNLTRVPYGPEFFAISFRFFAQLHILLCAAALFTVLLRRTGLRWLPAMLAVGGVSFVAEHLGTGYGVPFGGYAYTTLLGPRIGPRVPALIPLSWFLMSLPAWILAREVFPDRRLGRVTLAALGLVLWDLALDPAMSALTNYWVWEETGPYYGMPWLNLVGWFVTGLALMGVLEVLARDGRFDPLPVPWLLAYYGTVLLMPLGMLVAAASWLGVATTLGAYAVVGSVAMGLRGRARAPRMEGAAAAPSPVTVP